MQQSLRTGVGVFAPGTPLASDASIEVVTAPHNLQHARQAIRDSGYGGQRVAFMIPTNSAPLLAFGNVIYQRLKVAGLNIDYQAMDWGTLVSRRNQVDNGSWNTYITVNPGQYSTPATHYFLVSAITRTRRWRPSATPGTTPPISLPKSAPSTKSSAATSRTRPLYR